MSEWRPIETAPTAEAILIYRDDGEIELIPEEDNDFEWEPYDGINESEDGVSKPTHWMPLPEPPKAGA